MARKLNPDDEAVLAELYTQNPEAYRFIKLSNGKRTLVDADMFFYLSQWSWSMTSSGYVTRYSGPRKGETRQKFMHHEIVPRIEGFVVDHRNGVSLDNRRENLRHATLSQNKMNTALQRNNSSGFKGIYWNHKRGLWCARIKANRKRVYVGWFADAIEAAKAYNEAAVRLHGEFARLNVIPEDALCAKG